MFKSRNAISSLATASLAMLMASCQGTALDSSEKKSSTESPDSIISEFELRETIKTASESYSVVSNDSLAQVYYITVSTSVQWPEELGKYKIDNLRDSILTYTFGPGCDRDINKAIIANVTDVSQFQLGGNAQKIEVVPDSVKMREFYSTRTLSLVECNEQTVTYSASYSEFLGGAHPYSKSTPFTFVLETDSRITMDYLFNPGYEQKFKPILMEAIAAAHGISTEELASTFLLTPEVNNSLCVYLLNGSIVVHFDPYEILPYSFGPTDAYISPFTVAELLTPQAKKLLLD